MTVSVFVSTSTGSNTAILGSERLELPGLTLTTNAEEGSVSTSTVDIDDPDGDLSLTGWSRWDVYETALPSNDRIIWSGHVYDRTIERGEYATGVSRVWSANLADANNILRLRLLTMDAAERPAETDVARVTWLANETSVLSLVSNYTFLSTANVVDMDAADYRGQFAADLLNDCSQQSGKNWFVYHTDPDPTLGLFYDLASSSNFTTSLRISNVAADVDDSVTFYPLRDASLRRDPSRIYSGVYVPYDGGAVYAEDDDIKADFVWRDAVMPASNVKESDTATARGLRYLADIGAEDDRITVTIIVPAAKVNDIKAGHRLQVKFQHLPGYTDWTYGRILNRTITHKNDGVYAVRAEIGFPPPEPVPQSVYGILYRPHGPYNETQVWYERPGDDPPAGHTYRPTVGPITAYAPGSPPKARDPYRGWTMGGNGTISVEMFLTTIGVLGAGTVTCSIDRNGVPYTGYTEYFAAGAGQLLRWSQPISLTATNMSVSDGDIISVTLSCSPPSGIYFFRTPAGVGQFSERLEITGGSLL